MGIEYARKVAAAHKLTDLFEGYSAKPDIVIDDMPGTTQAPFAYGVQPEVPWSAVAEEIIKKHID